MKGRRENVETSPSHVSSVVSPPREVGGLSQIWPLPGICYGANVDGPQPKVPGIYLNLAFLHIMFSSVFGSFSLATTCSRTIYKFMEKVLVGETVFRHSDAVVSPVQMVLHYHCLNTSCAGLHEETGINAAIFCFG